MSAATEAVRTIAHALAEARARLAAAGVATAGIDARMLAGAATGRTPAALLADGDRPMDADAAARLEALLERRAAGEPTGRILGRRAFWTLDLVLSPDTLEPRPDTETLVEVVLAVLDREGLREAPLRIADLGTGSGAILLALLSECPNAVGIGTDLSAGALATARENARLHGLGERALFACADFAAALHPRVDVVVSNPPYVCDDEMDALERGVRAFDPPLALRGGPDGLCAYRTILRQPRQAARRDAAGGNDGGPRVFVELAPPLADGLASLAQAEGWTVTASHPDLAGRTRVYGLRLPK